MTHWQARATLENGAVMVLGVKADSDSEALDLAHERLEDTGQIVMDVEVGLLPASDVR